MHKVMSPISSCMNQKISSRQPRDTPGPVKPAMCHTHIMGLFSAVLAGFLLVLTPRAEAQTANNIEQNFASSLTSVPSENLAVSGAFYVPVYSSVSMSQGKTRADFSATLSIHNASETRPLVLKRIAYFDTGGKMVESYLKTPIALKPFSTVEVFVPTTDVRGGTGANFVVDWAATGEIAEPVVEALMLRPLREFLTAKLKRDAGIDCVADDILIVSGSLQALDLVNATLLARGDTVIVERETYQGALNRLTRLGVNAVGIPLDQEGMRMEALAAALADLKRHGVTPKYIYTIPTVQNPTGTIMPEARRAELLKLAAQYGVPIFEDDCYADLIWDGKRPPALYAMGRNRGAIHIGP